MASEDQVLQLTITHNGDAANPACVSYQNDTSSTEGTKKVRVDVGADAVQRSKLLQDLTSVADGDGQQGTCTTFSLPCSAEVFNQWHSFTVPAAKHLSVEALCQVLQVSTFLQDEPTAALCCTLLTSCIRSGLMAHSDCSSVITWDPSVWDSVSSITEHLLALPEPDQHRIVSHFHLQELLAAPVELLKQWLWHIVASGGVLDMHCLKLEERWEQAFVQLLSRLWRLLPGLEITELVLPGDTKLHILHRIGEQKHQMRDITVQLREAELPTLNSVTSIEFCTATSLEHLNTFLKLVPNVKSVRGATDHGLYPYGHPLLRQGEQFGEQDQAAVNDLAGILPQLQSLQALHVCSVPLQNERSQQAYTTFVGSMQQCTALTKLWLDHHDTGYSQFPDTLEALPSALATLQEFRLNVQLGSPFDVASIRAQGEVLSGFISLTYLSLHFSMYPPTPIEMLYGKASVEGILSVLGEVLQPLKLLRHLCLDTTWLQLESWCQCTRDAVASFITVLEQLDSIEVNGSLMCMLLPVLPSVSVVQSLRCRESDVRSVTDAQGVHSLNISTLSMLTGLKTLILYDYVDVDLCLAGVLKCLPDLRVLGISSGTEGDSVSKSILPHLAAVSKLNSFSYLMCWGQKDWVERGWKELAKAETLPMADSLTHLTLQSDSIEDGFPGILKNEDVPQFYAVLVRLTALRELNVDVLPTHSATYLTSIATLQDLERLSVELGDDNTADIIHLELLESDVEEVGSAIGSLTKLRSLDLGTFTVASTEVADMFAAYLTGLCQLRSVDVSFRLAEGGADVESSEDDDDVKAREDAMQASVEQQCWGAYVPVRRLNAAGR